MRTHPTPAHDQRCGRGAGIAATALLAACLASACTPGGDAAPAQPAATAPDTAHDDAAPSAGTLDASAGMDAARDAGARIDALTAGDVDSAALSGELACGFSSDGGALVFHAAGNVALTQPAQGVAKVSGTLVRVDAPGGFNAITRGSTFTGQGSTLTIALTGPATAGGESPPRPATLTYAGPDQARVVLQGQWRCGP